MISRSLSDLHPTCKIRVERWLDECGSRGLDVLVTCTYRSSDEQAKLYRRGRALSQIESQIVRLDSIGLHDMAQVLAEAPPQMSERKATGAAPGLSYHQRHKLDGMIGALAVDFIVVNGGKVTGYDEMDWKETGLISRAGELAEAVGLTWAGRWTGTNDFKELVHVQWDDGGRIKMPELALGKYG